MESKLSVDAIFTNVIKNMFGPQDPRVVITPKIARIDIEKEYDLIQQKKSLLSANMRRQIIAAWQRKHSRILNGAKLTYKDMIICFLRSKDLRLKDFGVNIDYITSRDIDEVRDWNKLICFRIWRKLKHNVFLPNKAGVAGLLMDTCPWCIRYLHNSKELLSDCTNCGYGKRHGICGVKETSNTFDKISEQVPLSTKSLDPMHYIILTNAWYKELITYIEENRV